MKLLADARIGARRVRRVGRACGGERRQRYAAPGGKRAHQHLPAFAGLLDATDDVIERNENVVAFVGAVLEHLHRGQMAPADRYARQIGRHQRDGDADIRLRPDQMVGIVQLEGKAEDGRDRTERDVALVPVQPDAEHLAAAEIAAGDDAGVGHRGGVRACFRTGEAEAGNFAPVGEPRQPVIALLLGPELQQQFARAERVRHHRGHRRGHRAGRQFAHHLGMRIGRKAQAAILLRDDHREELLRLQEFPHVRRQVVQIPDDVPLIEPAAELLDRPIEESLFFRRQRGLRHREKLRPIRIAGEDLGVPPYVAGFNRLALSGRQARQHALRPAVDVASDVVSAPCAHVHTCWERGYRLLAFVT